LPIADCRLTIEKVVWQLLPMSISNRQSKIGNSSHSGRSDDRRKPSLHEKKMKTSATERCVVSGLALFLRVGSLN